ncbi:glycosyltransferase [Patescibacteria group bacterium]|nr:glycosyltransferase [Patescibacteria group bacterium]
MNVLQINTVDCKGGAAKVATELQRQLHADGHGSYFLVGSRGDFKNPYTDSIPINRFSRSLNYRLHTNDTIFRTASIVSKHPWFTSADVVHFHNIHGGYFNLEAFPYLTHLKPSVWTLHDPWIVHEFGLTPEYNPIFKRISSFFTTKKQRLIKQNNAILISPSRWLSEKVLSCYPDADVRVIPNGIDTTIFHHSDKQACRKTLDLPLDKHLVLFVAYEGSKHPTKGWEYTEALCRSSHIPDDVLFVSIGDRNNGNRLTQDHRVIHIPFIDNPNILAQYYSACDTFLFPSLADNLPLVALEAMSCGLPVISFDTGGMKEIIDHNMNGYLVMYKNSDELLRTVQQVIAMPNDERQNVSNNAIKKIQQHFTLKRMVQSYSDIYEEAIKKHAILNSINRSQRAFLHKK